MAWVSQAEVLAGSQRVTDGELAAIMYIFTAIFILMFAGNALLYWYRKQPKPVRVNKKRTFSYSDPIQLPSLFEHQQDAEASNKILQLNVMQQQPVSLPPLITITEPNSAPLPSTDAPQKEKRALSVISEEAAPATQQPQVAPSAPTPNPA
jgi:hypothetical protein